MKSVLRRFLVVLLLLGLVVSSPTYTPTGGSMGGAYAVAATPAANQLVDCATLVANTGSGLTFIWAGAAQTCSNNNLIINRATFVSWIKNNGSCASGANATYYQMTWGDMLNCKSNAVSQHSVTIAAATGSTTYNCTFNNTTQVGSCGTGSTNEPYTLASTSSSTVAPTSTSTQLGISLTGVSLSDSCGLVLSYSVTLYNGATQEASWSGLTAASWSANWSNASAPAGTYTWKIQESSTQTDCGVSIAGGGSYTESVSWTGTNVTSYY